MKKLSLLLVLMTIAMTAMAQNVMVPSKRSAVFCRSKLGGAVNPVTHTTCVPQGGAYEIYFSIDTAYVLVKNLVYGSENELGDYWVYGTLHENDFTINLPQVINNGTKGRKAMLVWGTVSYDSLTGIATYTMDSSVDKVIYSMDNDKIVIENTSGPIVIDGPDERSYTASGPSIVWVEETGNSYDWDGYEWAGYCEWGTELPYVINSQPEGELRTYNRTSDCILEEGFIVWGKGSPNPNNSTIQLEGTSEIVFDYDGKTVYFHNPLPSLNFEDVWMMGTINETGSAISVRLPQYMKYNPHGHCIPIQMASSKIISDSNTDMLSFEVNTEFHEVFFTFGDNKITIEGTWADLSAPYPDNFTAFGLHSYDFANHPNSIEANIVYTKESDTPDTPTEINEVASGKQIAHQRYFNIMGQEIQQPNGLTIVVTTYDDGTTNAVKVVK